VVVLLRFLHPQHVVEEELRAVTRREPLVREARAADEHCIELADFAMDAEFGHG